MVRHRSKASQRLGQDVQEQVKLFVSNLKNLKIPFLEVYVFGSHARARAGERSDIDLFVVLPDKEVSDPFECRVRVMRAVTLSHLNADVVVASKTDFAKNLVSPILHQIRKDGIRVA